MEKKACSAQINYEMVNSMAYCSRKLANRIELHISQKFYERLQKKPYFLGGRFRQNIKLENHLKLIKINCYEDGYKVELKLLVFRVQNPKAFKGTPKDSNGEAFKSCPKLILKYIRTGHMPEIDINDISL